MDAFINLNIAWIFPRGMLRITYINSSCEWGGTKAHYFAISIISSELNYVSAVLDRFLSYLAQMITNIRLCVMCNHCWPWPISSRSFARKTAGKSPIISCTRCNTVTFVVMDGLFTYLAHMVTCTRRCVVLLDAVWPWYIFWRSAAKNGWSIAHLDINGLVQDCSISKLLTHWRYCSLALSRRISALQPLPFLSDSLHIWHNWSIEWESASRVMTFQLDLCLQGFHYDFDNNCQSYEGCCDNERCTVTDISCSSISFAIGQIFLE